MFDDAVAVLAVVLGFALLVTAQFKSFDSIIVNACKAQGVLANWADSCNL